MINTYGSLWALSTIVPNKKQSYIFDCVQQQTAILIHGILIQHWKLKVDTGTFNKKWIKYKTILKY